MRMQFMFGKQFYEGNCQVLNGFIEAMIEARVWGQIPTLLLEHCPRCLICPWVGLRPKGLIDLNVLEAFRQYPRLFADKLLIDFCPEWTFIVDSSRNA